MSRVPLPIFLLGYGLMALTAFPFIVALVLWQKAVAAIKVRPGTPSIPAAPVLG